MQVNGLYLDGRFSAVLGPLRTCPRRRADLPRRHGLQFARGNDRPLRKHSRTADRSGVETTLTFRPRIRSRHRQCPDSRHARRCRHVHRPCHGHRRLVVRASCRPISWQPRQRGLLKHRRLDGASHALSWRRPNRIPSRRGLPPSPVGSPAAPPPRSCRTSSVRWGRKGLRTGLPWASGCAKTREAFDLLRRRYAVQASETVLFPD